MGVFMFQVMSRLVVALLLAAGLAASAVQAQRVEGEPGIDLRTLPVIPIDRALEDRDGNTVPDLLLKPVRVQGVVTIGSGVMADDRLQIYVQDATGGVPIFSRRPHPEEIPPGTLIDVAGILDQYRGAPQIIKPHYSITGRAPLPAPVRIGLADIQSFRYYGRLVEVDGTVGRAVGEGPNTSIALSEKGMTTALLIPASVARSLSFASMPEGSRVTVTGVVSIYSLVRPYQAGFRIIVADPAAIRVTARPLPQWARNAGMALLLAGLLAGAGRLMRRTIRQRAARRGRHIAVLNEVSSSIAKPVQDVDSLLNDAVSILMGHRLIDGAIVHLLDENVLTMRRVFGLDDESARIADAQIQSRIPPGLPAARGNARHLLPGGTSRDSTAHPLLCVPLQGRERMIGILTTFSTHRHTPSPDEASTIAAAANLIALGIESIRVLHESEQRQEDLKQLAITDPLTGLYNRRFLNEYLRIQIPMAKRQSTPISFISLDLDRFKAVNDTHGHEAGDLVLTEVGSAIRKASRASDLPVRLGGEEFLVVMPATDQAGAVMFAKRLQKDFLAVDLTQAGIAADFRITASFGIGVYPDHGENVTTLLRVVDQALYESKHAGRDRITIAPAPFHLTGEQKTSGESSESI